MSAHALPWFESDSPRDLGRWSFAAAVVLCAHAAAIAAYVLFWHAPNVNVGDETPIISLELTAPQVDQVQQEKVEAPTPPKQTTPDAVIPVPKPPPKVEQTNPAPRTTVHEVASAPRIDPSWQSLLLKHLQEFKNYPFAARRRNEQGVVLLAFSIDRAGHVVSRRIVKGSGYADLDAEVLALVERAQPMPAFPPSMTEAQLDLTVPIRFSLH
ncbi:MAG: energy transducer TonB [Xanthobacteraceae bacterium]